MRNNFFYRNWWLFYLLMFLLLGILIYAFLWKNHSNQNFAENHRLRSQNQNLIEALEECGNSPTNSNAIDCNTTVNSGGEGFTSTEHKLGNRSGIVVIKYDAQRVPDDFKVIYDGNIVASTNGLVSGIGTISWQYRAQTGKPDYCIIEVSAPHEQTVWEYIVNCPE